MTFAFYWLKSMKDGACLYYKLTHELEGLDELKKLKEGGVGPATRKAKVIKYSFRVAGSAVSISSCPGKYYKNL